MESVKKNEWGERVERVRVNKSQVYCFEKVFGKKLREGRGLAVGQNVRENILGIRGGRGRKGSEEEWGGDWGRLGSAGS